VLPSPILAFSLSFVRYIQQLSTVSSLHPMVTLLNTFPDATLLFECDGHQYPVSRSPLQNLMQHLPHANPSERPLLCGVEKREGKKETHLSPMIELQTYECA
jgi:hypothetical protein